MTTYYGHSKSSGVDFHSCAVAANKLIVVLLAVAALLLLIQTQVALAHARLINANIQPDAVIVTAVPATLTLTFSEETSPTQTRLEVLDASGKAVDKGDLKVNGDTATVTLSALVDGKYTVKFRSFTEDDSKVVEGQYTFTVAKSGTMAAGDPGKATQVESQDAPTPAKAPATGLGGVISPVREVEQNHNSGNSDWTGLIITLVSAALFAQLAILFRVNFLRESRKRR